MVRMVNGTPRPFGDDKPSGGGGAGKVVGAIVLVGALSAGGVGLGGGLSIGAGGGTGAVSDTLAGNSAGGVKDALGGRNLTTRKADAQQSAKQGKSSESWSKMALKQLKKEIREEVKEAKCAALATDQVREFLQKTPCTSMTRVIFPLGDGNGNAAVVSVVWVGFKTRAHAEAFEKLENQPGVGDIKPLGASLLGLANISFAGLNYGAHRERTIIAVAEAENAAGHFDAATLDAIAEVSAWLPRP